MRRPETGAVDGQLKEAVESIRVRCDRFVVVESLPYFVQFMPNHKVLYGEVVSNYYLKDADHLSGVQIQRLVDLGWGLPGTSCHPACHSPHPNFTMSWPSTTPSATVARDLLRGLLVASSSRGEGAAAVVIASGTRVSRPTDGAVPGH